MYVVTARPDDKSVDAATRMVQMAAELVQGVLQIQKKDQSHLMVAASAHVGTSHSGVAGDQVSTKRLKTSLRSAQPL
jgi:hypothetical protein